MSIRIMLAFAAAALGAAAIQNPAAATAIAQPSKTEQQCRWEPATQLGPRAQLRPATRVCPGKAPAQQACGRTELYWPHWLSQRALPPVRRWVAERC